MDYITTKEAVRTWNISKRRVQILYEQHRIEGVQHLGRAGAIQHNVGKPLDVRKSKRIPISCISKR
jgi:hypothetical protein